MPDYTIRVNKHYAPFYCSHLTLKTTLSNISAATNTCEQSSVAFKVFVIWQCYYTRDVIGIEMTYRDLPYNEDNTP